MSEPTIIFPAEWSPQDAVAIAFPHDQSDWSEILEQVIPVFTEIIVTISRYEKVLVICQEISKVKELFPAESRENILFFEIPANDTWARDFMPLTVLHDCNPVFFKYMFNGWGLKFPADLDNLIASKLYETGVFNQIPLIQGGIVAEGGAFESDGLGTLMSTTQTRTLISSRLKKSSANNWGLRIFYGYTMVIWLVMIPIRILILWRDSAHRIPLLTCPARIKMMNITQN